VLTDAGAPVSGARVRVWGTEAVAESGADGAFALAELPAGTFTLEARAIGREPARRAVALASGRVATAVVRMAPTAPVLERVVVMGQRTQASKNLEGFLARKRTGIGAFVTRADIERRAPLDVSDVLRTTAGLTVIPTGRAATWSGAGAGASRACSSTASS
jgi:hypothetical protein